MRRPLSSTDGAKADVIKFRTTEHSMISSTRVQF